MGFVQLLEKLWNMQNFHMDVVLVVQDTVDKDSTLEVEVLELWEDDVVVLSWVVEGSCKLNVEAVGVDGMKVADVAVGVKTYDGVEAVVDDEDDAVGFVANHESVVPVAEFVLHSLDQK